MIAHAPLRSPLLLSVLGVGACTLNWEPRHDPDAGDAAQVALDAGDASADDAPADAGQAELEAAAQREDAGPDAAPDLADAGEPDTSVPDPGFTVSQEGLHLWLRADRGVTSSAGRVTSWADQSSHHADTGQLTADFRPTLVKPLDGVPGVVFDGVDDYLVAPAGFDDFSAGVTLVAVVGMGPSTLQVPLFEASNGSEIDDVNMSRYQDALLLEVDAQYLQVGRIDGDAVQLLVSVLTPGLDAVGRRNGATLGTVKFDHLPASVRRDEVFVGRSLYHDVTTFPGVIHELLVYGRALPDAELLELEQSLARRWRCCGP